MGAGLEHGVRDGDRTGQHEEPGKRRRRIEPLTRSTARRLRLPWSSRFDYDDLDQLLQEQPGLSLWVPNTAEYLIGGSWRYRVEIAGLLELSAGDAAVTLLDEFAEVARDLGKVLVIASEHHESRRRAFYDAAGYDLIEEIIIYELLARPVALPDVAALRFERSDPSDPATQAELLALDHAAFPWLWWNSRDEFENYGRTRGVEVYLGRDAYGRAVTYVGLTHFRDWGHLDRIAVSPAAQGRGLGKLSLDWAVSRLSAAGAHRVGLSTQARNRRSRLLYERYGFRRVPTQDYALYGRWLGAPEQQGPHEKG